MEVCLQAILYSLQAWETEETEDSATVLPKLFT